MLYECLSVDMPGRSVPRYCMPSVPSRNLLAMTCLNRFTCAITHNDKQHAPVLDITSGCIAFDADEGKTG